MAEADCGSNFKRRHLMPHKSACSLTDESRGTIKQVNYWITIEKSINASLRSWRMAMRNSRTWWGQAGGAGSVQGPEVALDWSGYLPRQRSWYDNLLSCHRWYKGLDVSFCSHLVDHWIFGAQRQVNSREFAPKIEESFSDGQTTMADRRVGRCADSTPTPLILDPWQLWALPQIFTPPLLPCIAVFGADVSNFHLH